MGSGSGKQSDHGDAVAATLAPVTSAVDATLGASGVDATLAASSATASAGRGDAAYSSLIAVDPSHYAIQAELARGGMGRIMVARDRRLDRVVAVKLLQDRGAHLRARFEREVRITAKLQHPAIVPVYEAGRLGEEEPFYAMKLVAGEPLDRVIARTTTFAERVALLPVVIAVADALAYAHDRRVIHRDLKPHNVLVGKFGETIVIDWGLAKDLAAGEADEAAIAPATGETAGMTVIGEVMGTPSYMPPEQAMGGEVDERADVYAIGAILYHVLAGIPPYTGGSSHAVLEAVRAAPPTPLGERIEGAPTDLLAIVSKSMARDAEARYPQAAGVAEDLRRFQSGQLVGVHRYSVWQLVRRWISRHRAAVAVAAAALVSVGVLAAYATTRITRARDEALRQRDDARAQKAHADDARALADQKTLEAKRTLRDFHEEQGLNLLAAGEPEKAAVPLTDAYAIEPSPALRVALALAMRPLDARRDYGDGTIHAMSPDGGRVLVHASDRLEVRDLATGATISWFDDYQGHLLDATFSPDGGRVIVGSQKSAAIWDAATGALVVALGPVPGETFSSVGFSRDGTRAVTASVFGFLRVWDATTGAKQLELGADDTLDAGWFTPDGTRLLTAPALPSSYDRDEPVRHAELWNAGTGRRVLSVPMAQGGGPVALTLDGEILVTADGATIRVWAVPTGKLVRDLEGHDGRVVTLAISPDGERLLSSSEDRTARIWDLRTGTLWATLSGHTGVVEQVAFYRDGAGAVTQSQDGTVRLWDVPSGAPLAVLRPTGRLDATRLVMDADHTRLAGGGTSWDLTAATPLIASAPLGISSDIDAAGTRVATIDARGLGLIDASSGARSATKAGVAPDAAQALSPDGERVVLVTALGASLLDATLAPVAELDAHGLPLSGVEYNADGTRLVAITADDVRVFDAATGSLQRTLRAPTAPGWVRFVGDTVLMWDYEQTGYRWDAAGVVHDDVRFGYASDASPDGTMLAVSSGSRSALWSVATQTDGPMLQLPDDVGLNANMVRFSPDGRTLATVGMAGKAYLFDTATGAIRASLDDGTDELNAVAFAPTGDLVATSGSDVRVWEASTGRLVFRFEGVSARGLAFSADGDRLVCAGLALVTFDLHQERRSLDELRARVTATTTIEAGR